MKKRFICFLFLILYFVSCILYSVSGYAGVREIKFNNGLAVLLKKDHRLPIVSIQFWVKTGSRNEDITISGISHLIEHMLFKGTQKYPGEVIQEEIEKRGGIINAGTSKDFTYFYVTLPTRMEMYLGGGESTPVQVNQNSLSIGLDVLFQMVRKASFAEDELEREKFVILEEIDRQWDNPHGHLWNLLNSILYPDHPYSLSVLGTSESVRNISKESILNYYNKFYILANCTLVIIGDFKERDVVAQIKKQILDTKYQVSSVKCHVASVKYEEKEKIEQNTERKNLEIEKPVHQVYLMLGTMGPDAIDDNCYSMDIISYILGKGRYSRLYRKLREEEKLVWSVSCSFLTQKEKGPFYISVECDADKVGQVKEIIFQELKTISEKPVAEDEIKRAKALFESEYLLDAETYTGEAFNLGYYQTIGSYRIALEYMDKILKVTSKDIQRTAEKYLNPENFISVMIKPSEKK